MTGTVGLKPTYGRVSRYGIVAFASSLDQVGPIGRDARDAAALLHAVSGRDERDATSAPVPVPDELLRLPGSDDEAASLAAGQAVRAAKGVLLAGHGARRRGADPRGRRRARGGRGTVEEVSLPHTDYGLAAYYIVAPAEASSNLARYDGVRSGTASAAATTTSRTTSRPAGRASGLRSSAGSCSGTYALSAGYYDAFYLKAQKVRTLIKRDFDRLWRRASTRWWPDIALVAWPFGAKLADPVQMYLADVCTLPVNMAGLPGISIPCGLSDGYRWASS